MDDIVTSPNHSSRKGAVPEWIIIHHTASDSIESTIEWFKHAASKVSAHYVVGKDGEIVQMVDEARAAWHCKGHNRRSIGIECVSKNKPLTPEQEKALICLIKDIRTRYEISLDKITGHRFMAGQATKCPGMLFGEFTEKALKEWLVKIA